MCRNENSGGMGSEKMVMSQTYMRIVLGFKPNHEPVQSRSSYLSHIVNAFDEVREKNHLLDSLSGMVRDLNRHARFIDVRHGPRFV